MHILYGLTISALLVGMSRSVSVRECDNDPFGTPKPTDVRVEGCTVSPCKLRRNGTLSIEFDFVIREDADIVIPEFLEIYEDYYQKYLVYPEDLSCNGVKNTKCPLKAGKNVTYANTMTVYDKADFGYGIGRFVLFKGVKHGRKIICFDLPVFILGDR